MEEIWFFPAEAEVKNYAAEGESGASTASFHKEGT